MNASVSPDIVERTSIQESTATEDVTTNNIFDESMSSSPGLLNTQQYKCEQSDNNGDYVSEQRHRILKIDRTGELGDLHITEDDTVYTKNEKNRLLKAIGDGNRSSGGLQFKSITWGLIGFIKFTGDYYMLLITKRSQVAVLGGRFIYQIDDTELVPLTSVNATRSKLDRQSEETRFVNILKELDLTRSFYFSQSYDITNTLQKNIRYEREYISNARQGVSRFRCNEMFIWNHYLLKPVSSSLKCPLDWCIPIVHGFVDQASMSIYGRSVYITIIARRSRIFAGARYLKRGANDLGYVANDVETEQIVSEMLTTSFHGPGSQAYASTNYTSYVQHRGSIPLYWTQDSTGVTPTPDIKLNLIDPFYEAAALHFDNLFERYGAPIYVLNLIKSRERTPRESKLLKEFTTAIAYLNQFLPKDRVIHYKAWDMSRASKSRDQDVIGTLEDIANDVLQLTGFFHNGNGRTKRTKLQYGVVRTNCIDCLDRTNAAQFVIGKLALGHQLHALGVIDDTSVDYDTDAVNLFTHMFHDHGNTIAVQYGGSHLVNTMETYRKINQWSSHSRDMVESFKRYYNNSFLDAQRQESYNLFLGNYIFAQDQPMLWDLSTDYYLHHADPRFWLGKGRKNYIKWFTAANLMTEKMPKVPPRTDTNSSRIAREIEDYWLEYYRPLTLSSLSKVFSYHINSTLRYMPFRSIKDGMNDQSPFSVKDRHETSAHDTSQAKKGVKIVDPTDEADKDHMNNVISTGRDESTSLVTRWHRRPKMHHGILKDFVPRFSQKPGLGLATDSVKAHDKLIAAQRTLNEMVHKSLTPSVSTVEKEEYGRYISHPLNLPLIVSPETPWSPSHEFWKYLQERQPGLPMDITLTQDDIANYNAFLEIDSEPLTVTEADLPKKRYKAYRQWLKGKSLFKQARVEG